ncbi:[LysW]-aminoadipate/[LysW]-glutamate kinase [Candidatus Bathyarchaeota archaeon]|nr:[LysW]-aminoadipate/[LysW]-glutamate kinase [Candidatus Bathyarchaeota archaeon]
MLITIKVGGDILVNQFPKELAEEIKNLSSEHKFVLIHGGGDIVTDISTKMGHPPKFVMSPRGFKSRYTDKETAEIYTMVMAGKINKEIVSVFQKNGINAIGLCGLDAGLVKAIRKEQIIILNDQGKKILIDGGYTGQIDKINDAFLSLLINNDYIPIICAVAMGSNAEPLNVDGDRMAAKISSALKSDILILLTDVEGILIEGKILEKISSFEVKDLLEKIGPGMSTKVYAAQEAVNEGVKEVIITSGFRESAIISAINHKVGTVIKK